MITFSYGVTFHLDEEMKPIDELFNSKPYEPVWYIHMRHDIVHRLLEELEDDLNKCDPSIRRVCLDHMSWVDCVFDTDDSSIVRFQVERVQKKIQDLIDGVIARYPDRIRQYHDELIADGEEIPVDPQA